MTEHHSFVPCRERRRRLKHKKGNRSYIFCVTKTLHQASGLKAPKMYVTTLRSSVCQHVHLVERHLLVSALGGV